MDYSPFTNPFQSCFADTFGENTTLSPASVTFTGDPDVTFDSDSDVTFGYEI